MNDESRSFLISGRVQGVGFRWWTRREAQTLGIRGWVRNLPDGDVEVHAAGDAAGLEALEGRLRQGPGGAGVEAVRPAGPGRDLPESGFEIRRTPGGGW